ncbi:hypothetical protein HUO13_02015 [Saccharopolyspora erythraea]|uniref:hypothetical protein n=1 Tax=Saccharopolyspora erythraea TaxID=1836 RepID=UPI001BA7D40A|nr:hypothetical protein [Saccharopolyspora erythraea]QUG99736.1 hypothetical protein HUO13_02015 [Saccharopolyspora erythraea]
MKTDSTKPATGATAIGWILLALGILIWLAVIPLTGMALFLAKKITIEAGFSTFGAVAYGVVGAIGLSAVAASEHRTTRAATWTYLILLAIAILVALLLNSTS